MRIDPKTITLNFVEGVDSISDNVVIRVENPNKWTFGVRFLNAGRMFMGIRSFDAQVTGGEESMEVTVDVYDFTYVNQPEQQVDPNYVLSEILVQWDGGVESQLFTAPFTFPLEVTPVVPGTYAVIVTPTFSFEGTTSGVLIRSELYTVVEDVLVTEAP